MELKVPFRIKVVILSVNPLHPDRPVLPRVQWVVQLPESAFLPGARAGVSQTMSISSREPELSRASDHYGSSSPAAFEGDHL